jgi:hypothetical protein
VDTEAIRLPRERLRDLLNPRATSLNQNAQHDDKQDTSD